MLLKPSNLSLTAKGSGATHAHTHTHTAPEGLHQSVTDFPSGTDSEHVPERGSEMKSLWPNVTGRFPPQAARRSGTSTGPGVVTSGQSCMNQHLSWDVQTVHTGLWAAHTVMSTHGECVRWSREEILQTEPVMLTLTAEQGQRQITPVLPSTM